MDARTHQRPAITERRSLSGGGVVAALRDAFASFPIACFTLVLITDILYRQTANLLWQNFSAWLLFAGLVGGALALLVDIVAVIARRGPSPAALLLLDALVLVVAFVNSLVHARDGWTGVVPLGLALSALTVVLMIVAGTAWRSRSSNRGDPT